MLTASVAMMVSCATPAVTSSQEQTKQEQGNYAPDTLIIRYDKTIGKQPLLDAVKAYGATVKYDYDIITGIAIKLPTNKSLRNAEKYFKKVKGVTAVERDYYQHTMGTSVVK